MPFADKILKVKCTMPFQAPTGWLPERMLLCLSYSIIKWVSRPYEKSGQRYLSRRMTETGVNVEETVT